MDNLIVKLCLSILLCTIAAASPSQSSPSESVSAGMRVLLNSYSACEHDEEMINCLKYKFLRLADRMLNTSRISMYDGVSLVSKPGSRAFSFQREEAPIFDSRLSEDARESRIDSLIWQRVASLVNTKSVQFDMPKLLQKSAQWIGLGEEEEEEVDGGRGKKEKKKKSLLLLAAMMVKGTMVALMFKKLALLAGSALVVSKIALTLAGLIAIKKLFSQPAPEKTTYEIVKTPVVTHAHEYSHHGYSGGDEHSNSYGRSLEKEEFERRRIQAKRSPVVKYEKYEPTPSHETPSKLPFYYINEADIVSDDQENGNTVEQEFSNNQGYDANHIAEIEEPVYENDRSSQRWSPKLSETVEPIRNTAQRYNQYGYRSARVMSLENVKDGDTSGMLSGAVEPSATQINAIYRSMRGSKAMRTDSPSGESTNKVEASDNSSTKVDKETSTAKVEKDSSAAKMEPFSTSDVQSPSSKFESRRRSRVSKEATIPTNEKKSER